MRFTTKRKRKLNPSPKRNHTDGGGPELSVMRARPPIFETKETKMLGKKSDPEFLRKKVAEAIDNETVNEMLDDTVEKIETLGIFLPIANSFT